MLRDVHGAGRDDPDRQKSRDRLDQHQRLDVDAQRHRVGGTEWLAFVNET
jgi:hypothetical protein